MYNAKSIKRIILVCLVYLIISPASVFGQTDALIWAPAMSNSPTDVIEKAQSKSIALKVQEAQELIREYNLSYGEISNSLCELGFSIETVTDITTVNLNNYMAVFGVLGYFPNNHVVLNGSVEAGDLETYISNGGNVYLEGGDMWFYDPMYANGHDFGPTFGILGLDDGASGGELSFIIGSDIAQGLDFDFTIGADDFPDHITSTGTGVVIHSNQNPAFDCGVRNVPVGRTIGVSSSFGDLINGTVTRNDLMAAYLNFYGITGTGCQDLPPVVDFTVVPDTIVLGDSVFADASATYDPDGDSLIYNWDVTPPLFGQWGYYVFTNVFENGVKAYITPTGTGDFTVKLNVSDGILQADTTKLFHVKPKTENVSRIYSFVDTSWYRTNIIGFHEDKVLIPIQPLDIVRIYNLEENNASYFNDINIANTVRIYGLKNNLLFTGQQGNLSGFWGPGPISIDSVMNNWITTPKLNNYLPGSSDIYSLQFVDDYLVATDQNTLYNIGIEPNPSTPVIMASRQYSFARPYTAFPIYSYLYVGVSGVGRKIEVLDKSSLAYVDTLNLPLDWRNFNVFDTLMFVGFYDSLEIYSVADPLNPEKLSSITPPRPFNWMNRPPLNNFPLEYYGQYIQPNLLALWGSTNIGVVFYDIGNPFTPTMKGAWYTGKMATIREHDNNYYVMGFDVLGNFAVKDKYFGLNKVKLDFLITIPHANSPNLSENYTLYQNYPNPFNPSTTIHYLLHNDATVNITIYNILGQTIKTLVDNQRQIAGGHTVIWDGKNDNGNAVVSGIYFYKMEADNFKRTKKMLLVR